MVEEAVARMAKIPRESMERDEKVVLTKLEDSLNSQVFGQEKAASMVTYAIKSARSGLNEPERPVASLLFVGPTGVGKTEIAKQLAKQLTVKLNRFDMSEYQEQPSVARLIGSPPGYVGYDEAGQLTEKVRRRPYSVVLFDEIEKAHPDVMNILLQILDEGKINDAGGRTVSFENTVICMTSNAGSTDRVSALGFGKTDADKSRERGMKGLKDFLRPEFLSRVDEIVSFQPLSAESLAAIAALMLGEYKEPLRTKGIEIAWEAEALQVLCEMAKGGQFGARDLRRVIRKEVEDRIAEGLIANSHITGIHIGAAPDEGGVRVQLTGEAAEAAAATAPEADEGEPRESPPEQEKLAIRVSFTP
jgi:ATP-dependent Clp protease ATP-binding subunit ClpA